MLELKISRTNDILQKMSDEINPRPMNCRHGALSNKSGKIKVAVVVSGGIGVRVGLAVATMVSRNGGLVVCGGGGRDPHLILGAWRQPKPQKPILMPIIDIRVAHRRQLHLYKARVMDRDETSRGKRVGGWRHHRHPSKSSISNISSPATCLRSSPPTKDKMWVLNFVSLYRDLHMKKAKGSSDQLENNVALQ
nr:hypothetical protein [Tanacetum cinerariifolium]